MFQIDIVGNVKHLLVMVTNTCNLSQPFKLLFIKNNKCFIFNYWFHSRNYQTRQYSDPKIREMKQVLVLALAMVSALFKEPN